MTARMEVYVCEECGNIVEVLNGGGPIPHCCGSEMTLQEEKTADFKTEKHVPVVEKQENGVKVVVGSTLHPMEEDHYIQWIEVSCCGRVLRKFLKPGDAPEAVFACSSPVCDESKLVVREYCNKHGLWKA